MKTLSENLKQELINEYITSKISVLNLCRKYDIKLSDFYIIKGQEELKKGVELRREENTGHFKKEPKKEVKPKQTRKKRKNCEEDFFEFLDIEESVYWFAFVELVANLTDTKIQITLPPEDFAHFEKFKTSIESNHSVTILNNGKGILNIARPRMIQDINNHKEETMLPKTIPDHLIHHFLRGVFDAKGEFDIDENGTPTFSMTLPNKQLAEDCQKILMKDCNLPKTDITKNRYFSRFAITYKGEQVKKIMDYLYQDATVYLDRKFQKYQEYYGSRTNSN